MKSSPEILKPVRSLKPTTLCVGNPSEGVWEKTLDSYLKAIRFSPEETKLLEPGVFIHRSEAPRDASLHLFLELDLTISKEKLQTCRSFITSVQKELEAPCMLVFPVHLQDVSTQDSIEVRVMLSVPFTKETTSKTFGALKENCQIEGRIYVFDAVPSESEPKESPEQRNEAAQLFLNQNGLQEAKISIVDGYQAGKDNKLAGYILHPHFQKLVPDEKFKYEM